MTIKLVGSSSGSVALEAPASTTGGANIEFKLPVADGSNGQVLQTNGSGQLSFVDHYSFRARSSSSAWQSFGTTNFTIIPFNATDFDSGSNYNTSTYKYIIPIAGKYYFYTQMIHDGSDNNSGNSGRIRIYVGSDIVAQGKSGRQGESVNCSTIWDCTVGEEIYVHGAVGNTNVDDWIGGSHQSFFNGYFIGP